MFGTSNFMKLADKTFFKIPYAFIDTKDHLADNEFSKRWIPVKYLATWQDFCAGPYDVRFCMIPKRYAPGFEEVMDMLRVYIRGTEYSDYTMACEKVMNWLVEQKEREKFFKGNSNPKNWYKKLLSK